MFRGSSGWVVGFFYLGCYLFFRRRVARFGTGSVSGVLWSFMGCDWVVEVWGIGFRK